MKTTNEMRINPSRRVPIQFEADVRFDATPVPPPDRERMRQLFVQLQERLVEHSLDQTRSSILRVSLKRAANEAAAMAWTTPYPLLFLPGLFEEKALTMRLRRDRQQQIEMRSERWIETAF